MLDRFPFVSEYSSNSACSKQTIIQPIENPKRGQSNLTRFDCEVPNWILVDEIFTNFKLEAIQAKSSDPLVFRPNVKKIVQSPELVFVVDQLTKIRL